MLCSVVLSMFSSVVLSLMVFSTFMVSTMSTTMDFFESLIFSGWRFILHIIKVILKVLLLKMTSKSVALFSFYASILVWLIVSVHSLHDVFDLVALMSCDEAHNNEKDKSEA